MTDHGTRTLIPDADPQSAEVTLSRLSSSVGGVLRKNLAAGNIVAAVTIVVTSSGSLHWDVIEDELKGTPEEQHNQRLQINSARIAVVAAAKAIQEKATNAILSDIK